MRAIFCTLLLALAGTVHAIPLTVELHAWNEQCGNNNGRIEVWLNGGQPPYALSWSNGETFEYFIDSLDVGTYSLTVTDGSGAQVTEQVTIIDVPEIQVPAFCWNMEVMGDGYVEVSNAGLHACPSECNGGFRWSMSSFNPNVVLPVTFFPEEDQAFQLGPVFTGYCGQQEPVLQITDATGCTGTIPISPVPEANYLAWSLVNVEAACGNSGSFTINAGTDYAIADLRLLDAAFIQIGNAFNVQASGQDFTWNNLSAGVYHVEQSLTWTAYDCAPVYLDVTVPSAGNPCGTVIGSVFLDHDQDCAQDANDEAIPYHVLEVLPGPQYTITNAAGFYDLGLGFGTFTIDQQADGTLQQLCPPNQQEPFTLDALDPLITIDFADSSLVPLDVFTTLTSGPVRPGFVASFHGFVWNASGQLSGPLDASFTFQSPLTFVSAVPAPSTVVGNVITWTSLPALGAFGSSSFHVDLQVPPDVSLIGTTTTATLHFDQPFAESNVANNTATIAPTINGSFDPNDKVAVTSSGWNDALYFIDQDEWIDYAIRFQNTGTASAIDVVVIDTLDSYLDMGSFQQGVASHPFVVSFKAGRVVEWRFTNINLPDSNANEAASHGLVSFRIRPQLPLLPGTVIANTANIFFDFNDPVVTEPSLLTAEFTTVVQGQEQGQAQLELLPNPVSDQLRITSQGTIEGITIIAADGRELVRSSTRSSSTTLDVSGLRAGSYFVIATLSNGSVARERFIKQ